VRSRATRLAVGDLLALLAFAVIGLLSHDRAVSLAGLARDFLPVAIGYVAAALAFGAWRRPGPRTLLPAWLVGVTAGVVIRAVALGRNPDGDQLAFLGVTLTTTLALLLVARRVGARLGGQADA
jgi:hypothetical protein